MTILECFENTHANIPSLCESLFEIYAEIENIPCTKKTHATTFTHIEFKTMCLTI